MAVLRYTTSVTRVRFDASAVGSDGRTAPGAEALTTDILVDIQPATGEDLQTLPEGERERDVKRIYAEVGTFRTGSQHDAVLADQVDFGGVRYEVRTVQTWRYLLPHQRLVAVRLQEVAP